MILFSLRLRKKLAVIRSLLPSLFFNLRYLPLKQAVKLPILLYKPRFHSMKGQVCIEGDVSYGMIRLGFIGVPLYPNTGIVWENQGGTVCFKGVCVIGNASALTIGVNGVLKIADNFAASSALKLVCYHSVTIGEKVRMGWENMLIDTSFHRLKNLDGSYRNRGYAPVNIGTNNWFAARCMILPGAQTPDYCTFAAGSVLNKNYSTESSHSLFAGSPLAVKVSGVWRDMNDPYEYN